MEQHYELGQWLRQRYGRELLANDQRYTKDNIYIQSTDVDRTLMSALSNLAGLFSPVPEQRWNPNLMWQPIPVHTTPERLDNVLAAKRYCATYENEMKKYLNSDEVKALNLRFRPLYDYLQEKSGKTIDSFETVLNLYNTLFIENLYNMT